MKYVFFSLITATLSFKLKLKGTSSFLGEQGNRPAIVADPKTAIDLEQSEKNAVGYIFKNKGSAKVFDIEGANPRGNVLFWSKHGGSNQRFELALTGDGTAFMIKNTDGCLEAMENNLLKREGCDESRGRQLFIRVDSETNTEQPAPPKPKEEEPKEKSSKKDNKAPIIIIHEHNHKPRGNRIIERHYHHNNLVGHRYGGHHAYESNSDIYY